MQLGIFIEANIDWKINLQDNFVQSILQNWKKKIDKENIITIHKSANTVY